ncbi:hypothetical protein [Streptomyces sp. NPDC002187]
MIFHLVLVSLLCVRVGDKTSWKVGRPMAVGGVLLPLAMYIAFLIP